MAVSIAVLDFEMTQEVLEGHVYQYNATCVSFFSKALTNLICHFLVALSEAEFQSDYIPYR